MKVAIVGAGLIGQKRGRIIMEDKSTQMKWVVDINQEAAKKMAEEIGGRVSTDWKKAIDDKKVDIVIVATTHDWLAKISQAALLAGKHVLCEKPLGINLAEIETCVKLADKKKLVYKAGYNHRFHPAISRADALLKKGVIGKPMYIKGNYGHGGRPGYEKEWRMNKRKSGGGELIDQGAHLIDLSMWIIGIPTSIKAELLSCFWSKKSIEDNVFMILKNKQGLANLHASWTEWKNRFELEIYGTLGYLKIKGLGGSYGTETLIQGRRIPGKVPKEDCWRFYGKDLSWKREWLNMIQAIRGNSELIGSGKEGLEVMRVIENIYRQFRPTPK